MQKLQILYFITITENVEKGWLGQWWRNNGIKTGDIDITGQRDPEPAERKVTFYTSSSTQAIRKNALFMYIKFY